MTRIISTRAGTGQNFDTIYPDTLQEMHVDGIADVMLSPSVVKMVLYQTRPVDLASAPTDQADAVELRQATLVLSMPLPQLVQAFTGVLGGMATNQAAIEDAGKLERDAMLALLRGIKVTKAETQS